MCQVAFFLPQLVQQLRRDEGGLIRSFLLDAAQRSMLFAHHLVRLCLDMLQIYCLRIVHGYRFVCCLIMSYTLR